MKLSGVWSCYLILREKITSCACSVGSGYSLLSGSVINFLNPLSANFTKWSNTLKQFVGNLPTNCVSVLAICEIGA